MSEDHDNTELIILLKNIQNCTENWAFYLLYHPNKLFTHNTA